MIFEFLILWFLLFVFILAIIMSQDNLWWIGTSRDGEIARGLPWFKRGPKSLTFEGGTFYTFFGYCVGYRIKEVLRHWRDRYPAIFSSLTLTLVLKGFIWSGIVSFIISYVLAFIAGRKF